jgi:5-methylcytosine-specific restriction endonuclease McrA
VEGVRQWRARPGNRERVLATNRKSRLANLKREAERRRRYSAENRERLLEYKRRYRIENQESVQEYERRPERRKRRREYSRRYAVKNADRRRESRRRYFQREDRPCVNKSAECSSEYAVRGSVYCRTHKNADSAARRTRKRDKALRGHAEAQGWICTWCTLPLPEDLGDVHLDHIIPKAILVIEDDWNLETLHEKCNLEKRDTITGRAVALAAEHGIDLKSRTARQIAVRARAWNDGRDFQQEAVVA